MRPKDNKPHGIVKPSSPCPAFEGPVHGDHEPSPLPWCSDLGDHPGINWESAWIDLGGEG